MGCLMGKKCINLSWHFMILCYSWFQEDRCNCPYPSTNNRPIEDVWFIWSANSWKIWWLRFECHRICSVRWGYCYRWLNFSNTSSTPSHWTQGLNILSHLLLPLSIVSSVWHFMIKYTWHIFTKNNLTVWQPCT